MQKELLKGPSHVKPLGSKNDESPEALLIYPRILQGISAKTALYSAIHKNSKIQRSSGGSHAPQFIHFELIDTE